MKFILFNQLERDGLLLRSEEGKRRRRAMVVTDKGEQTLAAHWRTCLGFYMDVDSVLRADTTALLMGDQKATYHYLLNAADDHGRRSRGPHAGHPDYQDSLVDWYGYMRAQWETARLQSATQTLRNIGIAMEASAEAQPRAKLPPAEWLEGP